MKPTRSFDVRVNAYRGSTILSRGTEAWELHEVETTLWNLCDGNHTVSDLVQQITVSYGVDVATAEADVNEFLDELRAQNLIEMD